MAEEESVGDVFWDSNRWLGSHGHIHRSAEPNCLWPADMREPGFLLRLNARTACSSNLLATAVGIELQRVGSIINYVRKKDDSARVRGYS